MKASDRRRQLEAEGLFTDTVVLRGNHPGTVDLNIRLLNISAGLSESSVLTADVPLAFVAPLHLDPSFHLCLIPFSTFTFALSTLQGIVLCVFRIILTFFVMLCYLACRNESVGVTLPDEQYTFSSTARDIVQVDAARGSVITHKIGQAVVRVLDMSFSAINSVEAFIQVVEPARLAFNIFIVVSAY